MKMINDKNKTINYILNILMDNIKFMIYHGNINL